MRHYLARKPGRRHPAQHQRIAKAQPHMALLAAQLLALMRGKIHHQQPATGAQHAPGLAQHRRRIIGEVQHLVQHHRIGAAIFARQGIHVPTPHFGMGEAARLYAPARQPQHLGAAVNAQCRIRPWPEQLDHPAGAGADIHQRPQRLAAKRRHDRGFNICLGTEQRALPVPILRMGGKPGVCGGGALGAYRLQPGKVRLPRLGIAAGSCQAIDGGKDRPAQRCGTKPHEHPGALLGARHQPGIGKDAQMPRDTRLALAQNSGQLPHAKFHAADKQQDADPAGVRHGAKNGEHIVHRKADIKISLYVSTSDVTRQHPVALGTCYNRETVRAKAMIIRSPRFHPFQPRTALLLGLLALSACATPRAGTLEVAEADRWENGNRKIHKFNKGLDRNVVKPIATGYRTVVPKAARTGITNGFSNYGEPLNFINALLQGKIKKAFRTLDRFLINTTLGVGGLADNATDLGRPQEPEDWGQTFAAWGIKSGPYVVLPFFGPSTLRDSFGLVFDFAADPADIARNVAFSPSLYWRGGQIAGRVINLRSNLTEQGADSLLAGSLDEYTLMKSAYLQRRLDQLWDGNPPLAASELDGGEFAPLAEEPASAGAPAEASPPAEPAPEPAPSAPPPQQ